MVKNVFKNEEKEYKRMSKEELLELIVDLEERVAALESFANQITDNVEMLDEESEVYDFRISELETFVENVKNS